MFYPRVSQTRPIAAVLLSGLVQLACTGGDPAGEPTGPTAQVLDFAPIAGSWVGEVTDDILDVPIQYPARISVGEGAVRGNLIGASEYGPTEELDCRGSLFALEVVGSRYEVTEVIDGANSRGCGDGTLRLEYDVGEGTLDVRWYNLAGNVGASGVLIRAD